MTTKKTEQKSGLSTTSLILSILGLIFSLTIIGVIIGIRFAILGLILGIVALIKKQKKGLAIAGTVIGGIVTLITIVVVTISVIFLKNNANVIIDPIVEISTMMKDDPELSMMMNDPAIQAEFEKIFTERLTNRFEEKFGYEDKDKTLDDFKLMIPIISEEMKAVMLELKKEHKVK